MALQQDLRQLIAQALTECGVEDDTESIQLARPEREGFGDLSTNVVFTLAKKQGVAPNVLGALVVEKLLALITAEKPPGFPVALVELKNGGFINFTLKDSYYLELLDSVKLDVRYGSSDDLSGQEYVVEYTDPNPFKLFHIGHLMTNTIGEALARIFAFSGASVRHANYQGDVGMHVAKSVWGLVQKLEVDELTIKDLAHMDLVDRVAYMGKAYAMGNTAYTENEEQKAEIERFNVLCYITAQELLSQTEGWEPQVDYTQFIDGAYEDDLEIVRELYTNGRTWTLEYFETIYKRLGTSFQNYYFESKVGEYGLGIVKKHIEDGVFTESEGAVVFKGEEYGLHTRVFINQKGLPLYEAKDLALAYMKQDDKPYDRSFIVTGNDIDEYFKVVLTALAQIDPEIAAKTTHLGHGILNLKGGKMGSRYGNIIGGEELLDQIAEHVAQIVTSERLESEDERTKVIEAVAVGAWKYSVLKHKIGRDIAFDFKDSLALDGNSGPYLQYTYARTKSVLKKAEEGRAGRVKGDTEQENVRLNEKERAILVLVDQFPEVVSVASNMFAPHMICSYLYDLAQAYNSFYNEYQILVEDEVTQNLRLTISAVVATILKNGLNIIGIQTVERM